ncbi:actin nucleation-promoting factor WASL-like [Xyrauchen texanus]|uniref:actin nucleation-promoting factor WASL-like n=1 Tax=Xyrauchen texanus TaxID=154827 RepID=UPI002241F798|nr:actin nucleation-promoting factor WASL-like [Xyrauchen texanus]
MTPSQALKRALLNILDIAIVEMETRFSKSNLDLMKAVNCLQPQSPSFLDVAMLSPLQKMAKSDSDKLSNEILVAKIMLEKEFKKTNDDENVEFVDLSTICTYLHRYKNAFPQLHRMYVTSLATVLTPLGRRGPSSAMLYRTSSVLLLYNLRYQEKKQKGEMPKFRIQTLPPSRREKLREIWRNSQTKYRAKRRNLNALLNMTPPDNSIYDGDIQVDPDQVPGPTSPPPSPPSSPPPSPPSSPPPSPPSSPPPSPPSSPPPSPPSSPPPSPPTSPPPSPPTSPPPSPPSSPPPSPPTSPPPSPPSSPPPSPPSSPPPSPPSSPPPSPHTEEIKKENHMWDKLLP